MSYEAVTVQEFLDRVHEAYVTWLRLLEDLEPSQFEQSILAGQWSIKDIIAHITWHEAQMVKVIEARALVGSDWWELPTDERNANIYEESKSLPLQDVLNEAKEIHRQLVDWIGTLSDADLNEPTAFTGMPSDWLFGDILSQNTFEHYRAHTEFIRASLTTRGNR